MLTQRSDHYRKSVVTRSIVKQLESAEQSAQREVSELRVSEAAPPDIWT